ncbi:hypothetical protein [Streptococcus ovis]|uniref:hypothetical protein n=1 Tax=Streptococcus ovis TaxID=82806 RepID=UPI00035DCE1C|nr:hypothetical protein [Streptococcus ovis]
MNIFELFGKIGIDNKPANKAIDETVGNAEKGHGKLSAIFGKIGQVAVKAGKVMATGLAVGVTALATLSGVAVKSYADYEQLVGGVETLFGAGGKSLEEYAQSVGKSVADASAEYDKLMNAQNTVLKNSKDAYRTAGLSANAYMETVTSFSASLIQSVGGDTEKAAKLADQTIVDMSDNANKMGTSMELIQNAYNGFSKQNYTMLDNLKLGYGGTKEEMERLLADAEKISGIKYDISSFADVTEAIHVMQEKMGIAETTSREASSTISGSIGMVKAAWENFLAGMSDPDQDFSALVGNLTDSIKIMLDNIIPRIVQTLPRLISGLSSVIQTLAGYLPGILSQLLPALTSGATALISSLIATLPVLFNTLLTDVLPQVATTFVGFFDKLFAGLPEPFQGLSTTFDNLKSIFSDVGSMLSDFISGFTGIDSGKESIDRLKDVLSGVSDFLAEATGKIKDFVDWFQKGGPAVDALKSAVVGVTTAWTAYKVVAGTIQAIETVKNTLLAVGNGLMLARFVQSGALTAAEATQAAATMGATGAFTAFNAVLSVNPIFLVVAAIAALVAGLVWFFTQTETGRKMWSSFMSWLSSAWSTAVATGKALWEGLGSFLSGLWSGIVSTATGAWDRLKNMISDKINAAKNIVSNVVEAIKGIFNFSWKLPDIKVPHFNVSGGEPPFGLMGKGSLPRIGVEWYAKGGIMTAPTMFGINGNNAMVGGEAGDEAILPLNSKTLGDIGIGVAETMRLEQEEILQALYTIIELLEKLLQKNPNIMLDGDSIVGNIYSKVKTKINREQAILDMFGGSV